MMATASFNTETRLSQETGPRGVENADKLLTAIERLYFSPK